MSESSDKPGKGLFGWLGRQVGHVKNAVRGDPAIMRQAVYRNKTIQEHAMPDQPNVKFRRTTIDEVVIDDKKIG